jgi:hypothetical protein
MDTNLHIVDYCHARLEAIHALKGFESLLVSSNGGGNDNNKGADNNKKRARNVAAVEGKRDHWLSLTGSDRQRNFGKRNERRRTTSIVKYRIPTYRKLQAALLRSHTEIGRSTKRQKSESAKPRVRKHTRRPRSLLDMHSFRPESQAEQDSLTMPAEVWLETHIWHAKRMHMSPLWGHRLAIHNNSRGLKFLHKTVEEHSVIHDRSYYHSVFTKSSSIALLIEVCQMCMDPQSTLLARLRLMSDRRSHEVSPEILATEASDLLYDLNSFPNCCVGPVEAMIILENQEVPVTAIMLTIHPSIYRKVLDILQSASSICNDISERENGSSVVVEEVVNQWSRFSIRGKFSRRTISTLLSSSCRPPLVASSSNCTSEDDQINVIRALGDLLHTMKKRRVGDWQNGQAVVISVKDPRLCGQKQDKLSKTAYPNSENILASFNKLRQHAASSAPCLLWSAPSRKETKESFIPDHVLNSKLSALNAKKQQSLASPLINATNAAGVQHDGLPACIPLAVIRKCRYNIDNHFLPVTDVATTGDDGFDLLIPAGWASTLWKVLVYRAGARAIGVREYERVLLNAGRTVFPQDYLDTDMGTKYWQGLQSEYNRKKDLQQRILKLPWQCKQQRKPDADPVAISPAQLLCDWRILMASGMVGSTDEGFEATNADGTMVVESTHPDLVIIRQSAYFEPFLPFVHADILPEQGLEGDYEVIVPVQQKTFVCIKSMIPCSPSDPMFVQCAIHPVSRGIPKQCGRIYLPNHEDVTHFLRYRSVRKLAAARVMSGANGSTTRRIGDWKGIELSRSSKRVDRRRIGYITSGQSQTLNSSVVGVGLCHIEGMFQAHRLLWNVVACEQENDLGGLNDADFKRALNRLNRNEDCDPSAEVGWSTTRYCLVLVHNLNSSWLRPMLCEYLLC